jgi:hypothetical protein
MDMDRTLIQRVTTASVFVFGISAGLSYTLNQEVGVQAQTRISSFVPFVAHEEQVQFADASDDRSFTSHSTYARKRDGSFVILNDVTVPDGEGSQMIELFEAKERKVVTVEPFTKSRVTEYFSSAEMEKLFDRVLPTCSSLGITKEPATAAEHVDSNILEDPAATRHVDRDIAGSKTQVRVALRLECYPVEKKVTTAKGPASIPE